MSSSDKYIIKQNILIVISYSGTGCKPSFYPKPLSNYQLIEIGYVEGEGVIKSDFGLVVEWCRF